MSRHYLTISSLTIEPVAIWLIYSLKPLLHAGILIRYSSILTDFFSDGGRITLLCTIKVPDDSTLGDSSVIPRALHCPCPRRLLTSVVSRDMKLRRIWPRFWSRITSPRGSHCGFPRFNSPPIFHAASFTKTPLDKKLSMANVALCLGYFPAV